MRRLVIAISAAVFALSCDKAEGPVEVARLAPASTASDVVRSAASANADASSVGFSQSGQRVEVRFAGGTLTGEPRDSGKRKYRLGSGPITHEVKPNENGFKLRRADGSLLWKVKISPDKVKISDNEENRNPFELKRRDNGEVKVVAPGEREIGRVRSAAEGVLLIDSIPVLERHMLYGELMARKQ